MKRLFRNSAAALALAACSIAVAQQKPVEIVGLVELSGTGATAGANGDLDRESFLVKVENGKQVVTATLPPAGK